MSLLQNGFNDYGFGRALGSAGLIPGCFTGAGAWRFPGSAISPARYEGIPFPSARPWSLPLSTLTPVLAAQPLTGLWLAPYSFGTWLGDAVNGNVNVWGRPLVRGVGGASGSWSPKPGTVKNGRAAADFNVAAAGGDPPDPLATFGASLVRWVNQTTNGVDRWFDSAGTGDVALLVAGNYASSALPNGNATIVFDGTTCYSWLSFTELDNATGATYFGCFKTGVQIGSYATFVGKLFATVAYYVGLETPGTSGPVAATGINFGTPASEATDLTSAALDGEWHHFIFAWSAADGGALYIDGFVTQQWETSVTEGGAVEVPAVTEPATIGACALTTSGPFDYFFVGELADVGYVNRRATPNEILALRDHLDYYLGRL